MTQSNQDHESNESGNSSLRAFQPEKIYSFGKFWQESQEDISSLASPSDPTISALPANINLGIQSILSPYTFSLGLTGSSTSEIDKFSEELYEYVTSEEVISSLSREIGEPESSESEEDFIERASQFLRNLLFKRFNIS